jgi:hypothetical protein
MQQSRFWKAVNHSAGQEIIHFCGIMKFISVRSQTAIMLFYFVNKKLL